MNKIFLIGRLTKDPELRYTPSGAAVCSFTLAVDRRFTNQSGEREADFINIVVWNKAAENCAKYLSKGRQAAVEGRLQIRSFDGNDGQRKWVTEVIADKARAAVRRSVRRNVQTVVLAVLWTAWARKLCLTITMYLFKEGEMNNGWR